MTKVYTKMFLKACINNKYRDSKAKMIVFLFLERTLLPLFKNFKHIG